MHSSQSFWATGRARLVDVLVWVGLTYPELELRIA